MKDSDKLNPQRRWGDAPMQAIILAIWVVLALYVLDVRGVANVQPGDWRSIAQMRQDGDRPPAKPTLDHGPSTMICAPHCEVYP